MANEASGADRQREGGAQKGEDGARFRLAGTIVWASVVLLGLFGAAAIGVNYIPSVCGGEQPCGAGADIAKQILNALLPIISGWVGAVIAYYFAQQVQQEASRNTRAALLARTVRERVARIPITSVMLTAPEINYIEINRDPETGAVRNPLEDVLNIHRNRSRSRAPLFEWIDGAEGRGYFVLRSVIHESTTFEFLARRGPDNAGAPWTLGDLLSDPQSRARFEQSLASVAKSASLADAKAKMDANPRIQDVVVTLDGRLDQAFIGWITNVGVLNRCLAGAADGDDETR